MGSSLYMGTGPAQVSAVVSAPLATFVSAPMDSDVVWGTVVEEVVTAVDSEAAD